MDTINALLLALNLLFFVSTRSYYKSVQDLLKQCNNYYDGIQDAYISMKHIHKDIYDQYHTLMKQYKTLSEIVNKILKG